MRPLHATESSEPYVNVTERSLNEEKILEFDAIGTLRRVYYEELRPADLSWEIKGSKIFIEKDRIYQLRYSDTNNNWDVLDQDALIAGSLTLFKSSTCRIGEKMVLSLSTSQEEATLFVSYLTM